MSQPFFFLFIYFILLRRAKTKLPKDVKKKVDEWKSGSGALAICFLAYYDGSDIQAFQYVHSYISTSCMLLT
jgi:hypothetical protein